MGGGPCSRGFSKCQAREAGYSSASLWREPSGDRFNYQGDHQDHTDRNSKAPHLRTSACPRPSLPLLRSVHPRTRLVLRRRPDPQTLPSGILLRRQKPQRPQAIFPTSVPQAIGVALPHHRQVDGAPAAVVSPVKQPNSPGVPVVSEHLHHKLASPIEEMGQGSVRRQAELLLSFRSVDAIQAHPDGLGEQACLPHHQRVPVHDPLHPDRHRIAAALRHELDARRTGPGR